MSAGSTTGDMTGGTTDDTTGGATGDTTEHRSGDHRRSPLRVVLESALVVLVMAAVGLGGGWLWHRWWAPAPPGVVGIPSTGTDQTPRWFPVPGEAGERAMFAGTAEYVILAVALGLVLGVLAALLARRSAFVTLVAVVVGSLAAAFAMYRLGTHLAPPDPDPLARTLDPGTKLPGTLSIAGLTPFLAWPVGALLGFCFAGLAMVSIGRVRAKHDDPRWLQKTPVTGSDAPSAPAGPAPESSPDQPAHPPPL